VVEASTLDIAVRHLQKRFVRLRRCALALDIGSWGAAIALVGTVAMMLSGWSMFLLYGYGIILAGCAITFLIMAWRVHIPALAVLQQADRIQHFQERLSTAYEYLAQHDDNPFVPGLQNEAERVARQVDACLVFPTRWARRWWILPLCLATIIGVSFLDLQPVQFDDFASEGQAPEISREGKRIEQWGRRLEEVAKQQQLDRSLVLARHMQNLGRRLQHERSGKPAAAQRISTLSQYLQRMQQELLERALMTNAGGIGAQDVMMSGKSFKQELQDILKLLQNDELPREMTTVAEEGIRRLSQHLGGNPDLERIARSLQAGNLVAARQLLQDVIQQQQAAEELEHLQRARQALDYSSRSIQHGGESSQPQPKSSARLGSNVADSAALEFDDAETAGDMSTMEDNASPASDEGFGTARYAHSGPSNQLRESEQPLSRVTVKQGKGDMRLAYIRRLPMQNEAHMPMEQVVVHYQKQAEDVLNQEHIPRTYREQVKQYFLAIGMLSEDKQ
jgi:hypothetical protein